MKKIIRFWTILKLAVKDPLVRKSLRAALYYLSSFKETSSDQFYYDLRTWSNDTSRLQQYHSDDIATSGLPQDFSLIESYPEIKQRLDDEISSFGYQPLITLVLTFYGVSAEMVEVTLNSISKQFYQRLEIYVVADSELGDNVAQLTAKIFPGRSGVTVKSIPRLGENLGAAFNEVLDECKGDFLAFVSSGDTISREAILEIVRLLNRTPEVDVIYSDESKQAVDNRIRAVHKPGWSRDLFLCVNYIQHFLCCRRDAIRLAGGFSTGFESDIKYDLVLRIIEHRESVVRIPKILYHEEVVFKSWPRGYDAGKSFEMRKGSLEAHLKRLGIRAEVSEGLTRGSFRVRRDIAANEKISIIIPTRDQIHFLEQCIESIESKSTFPNYEIIIVDNGSVEPATADYFARTRHTVIRDPAEFNFSRLNNTGAQHATGDHLLFLNNDTKVITPGWLEALLEHSQRPEVGVVGAKLLYPNGMIQHAGMVLGGQQVSEHVSHLAEIYDHGYRGFADVTRSFSCVTGACLMTRTSVFNEIGGFDEGLAITYNDVDLCLKARARGYLVIYTPYALLYHHQGVSMFKKSDADFATIEVTVAGQTETHKIPVPRGRVKEIEQFYSRWRNSVENDVNYTPRWDPSALRP